jgi:calcineurin-like phosphoesterase family protein
MKTFFISDMHFGHTNIIKYENRPFESAAAMDITIIQNWNKVANRTSLIFVLGDVSFYHREKTQMILQNLHGKKILILGNHDKARSSKFWREVGFHEVYKYPIIFRDFYILSHEPVYINLNMPYINIHGHLHSTTMSTDNAQIKQFFNVSVEHINYTPIDFDTILKRLKV